MNRIGNIAKMLLCLAVLGGLTAGAGAQEVLEQWGLAAVEASSEPATQAGSVGQAIGPPDSGCQSLTGLAFVENSWRPGEQDSGREWITFRFLQPVKAFSIEIYESLNPGAITAILVQDSEGKFHEVWAGDDPNTDCPAVLEVAFPSLVFSTSVVRIELNTTLVPGWNQIDAIKLTGYSPQKVDFLFEQVERDAIDLPDKLSGYTFVDYDNDGWPDQIGSNNHIIPYPLVFLHNEGNGRFSNRSGILPVQALYTNAGHIWGDYDNDGDLDLFYAGGSVARSIPERDLLLRNDGGNFIDVAAEAGLADKLVSSTAIWWDYNLDSFLDLYVARFDFQGEYEHPNALYKNNGDGTFSESTAEAGLDIGFYPPEGHYFSKSTEGGMVSADFNDDGWPDLYMPVLTGGANRLFINDGKGGFLDETTSEIGDLGEGVGVAVGDIDNDGDLDLFQPSLGAVDQGGNISIGKQGKGRSIMLLNLGGGEFLDVTEGVGLSSLAVSSLIFAHLLDIDNDGDLDLLTGYPLFLYLNNGDGTFVERSFQAGLSSFESIADFDGDGFLDVWSGEDLFRNEGNGNHWLRIELVGTESNRDGLGTRVIVKSGGLKQIRELFGGKQYFQDERMIHFGLGQRTQADELEVRWPSGQVDILSNIPADQEIRVVEGRGEWYPAPRTGWTVEPPSRVTYGQEVNFAAEVRPALFEPRAKITSITADLSSLGGLESVPLEDIGDGTYRLETRFAVGGRAGLRDVEVFIEQATTLGRHWINLSRNIEVVGDPNTAVTESYAASLPESFTLDQNYPNPFNAETMIRYALPTAVDVELSIFNLAGQQVATLVEGAREAGTYTVRWDGRDDDGRELASGVYLYRLQTGNGQQMETRKLALIR